MAVAALRKLIAVFGILSCIFSILVTVPMSVVTTHWSMNVECILYGSITGNVSSTSSVNVLSGSNMSTCYFTIVMPGVAMFFAVLIVMLESYRVYWARRENWESTPGTVLYWSTAGFILVITVLMLVVACMLLNGYLSTCKEIEKYFVPSHIFILNDTTGQMENFINRMDCSFYYDMLDFGLSVSDTSGNAASAIDTDLALQFAIISSWFAVSLWVGIFVLTIIVGRRLEVPLVEMHWPCAR